MRPKPRLFTIIAVMLFTGLAALAKEPDSGSQWYCFKMEKLGEVAGTSELTPDELAQALDSKEFLRLDNTRSFNGAGQWNKATPPFTDTIYIRPQLVQSFTVLTGAPVDFDPAKAK